MDKIDKAESKKVLIIGLDGATWDLIEPWARNGIMPNLGKLIENGTYGRLKSTIPPVTVPAWVSFATGKNAGKYGCYYFAQPKKSLSDLKPITTRDIFAKTFFEILEDNGKECVTINLPASYPPRTKGPVITSILTQGDNCVYPERLLDEIPVLRGYRMLPDFSTREKGDIAGFASDLRRLEKGRFECALELFSRNWDCFFVLFSGTDLLQHQMYGKLIQGKVNQDSEAVNLYRDIDHYIGWFLDNAPDNTDILIMSDHGFKASDKVFNINRWLATEGYLAMERGASSSNPHQRSMEASTKAKASKRNIRLPRLLWKHRRRLMWLYSIMNPVKKTLNIAVRGNSYHPVIPDSIAYSPFFGAIYINDKDRFSDGKVNNDEHEKLAQEIVNKLKQIRDPNTGRVVIDHVWRADEVYRGTRLRYAPDVLLLSEEYTISSSCNVDDIFFCNHLANSHALYGILAAYGPDISIGSEVQGADICDLAPTILHIFGLLIPKDMDGSVLDGIFRRQSDPVSTRDKKQHGK